MRRGGYAGRPAARQPGAVSRFGVVEFGEIVIDLELFGVNWVTPPEKSGAKVSYSEEVVQVLDRAVTIARSDGSRKVGIEHLLAAFANMENGLVGQIKRTHGLSSGLWRRLRPGSPHRGLERGDTAGDGAGDAE